jgi:acetyltransferase-like isoleucine patch superfamily enzyme
MLFMLCFNTPNDKTFELGEKMKKMNSRVLQEVEDSGGGVVDLLFARIITRFIRLLLKYKKHRYDRVVSFGDLLIDRTEKARFLNFGEGTTIYDSSLVIGDVKVGRNTWIGPYTIIDGSGGLEIGDFCSISAGVHIYTHDSVKWTLSGGRAEYERLPVKIGNCCYVGPQTIITRGTKIGSHCLIGANSIVNSDLDDYSIAAGSPCKIIGQVKADERGPVEVKNE